MSTCVQNCFALVLQNSSVLSVIPTKRHGEIYRESFLASAGLHVPASHFWVSQRRDHLPFIHVIVYWHAAFLHPTGSQGPVFKPGWLIKETACRKPTSKPGGELLWKIFRACWFVPVLQFASEMTGSGRFLFSSSDTNSYIFSRDDAGAITCAQQTSMSIESFWRSLGFFYSKKVVNLAHPFLEFVSGSQKITLSTSKGGYCASIQSIDTANTS